MYRFVCTNCGLSDLEPLPCFCTLEFGITVKEIQPKSQSQLPLGLSPIPLLWPGNQGETAFFQGKGEASESPSAHDRALLLVAVLGWGSLWQL